MATRTDASAAIAPRREHFGLGLSPGALLPIAEQAELGKPGIALPRQRHPRRETGPQSHGTPNVESAGLPKASRELAAPRPRRRIVRSKTIRRLSRFVPAVLAVLRRRRRCRAAAQATPSAPAPTARPPSSALRPSARRRCACSTPSAAPTACARCARAPGSPARPGGHSRDMVANRYFAHNSLSGAAFSARIARTGWMRGRDGWTVGENLAWGGGTRHAAGHRGHVDGQRPASPQHPAAVASARSASASVQRRAHREQRRRRHLHHGLRLLIRSPSGRRQLDVRMTPEQIVSAAPRRARR